MAPSRRLLAPSLAACCALALGACGEKRLDTGKIETGIKQGIEHDNPGTKVLSVSCPSEVKLKKGYVFTCKVKGSKPGQEAVATVREIDNKGRVHYQVP